MSSAGFPSVSRSLSQPSVTRKNVSLWVRTHMGRAPRAESFFSILPRSESRVLTSMFCTDGLSPENYLAAKITLSYRTRSRKPRPRTRSPDLHVPHRSLPPRLRKHDRRVRQEADDRPPRRLSRGRLPSGKPDRDLRPPDDARSRRGPAPLGGDSRLPRAHPGAPDGDPPREGLFGGAGDPAGPRRGVRPRAPGPLREGHRHRPGDRRLHREALPHPSRGARVQLPLRQGDPPIPREDRHPRLPESGRHLRGGRLREASQDPLPRGTRGAPDPAGKRALRGRPLG